MAYWVEGTVLGEAVAGLVFFDRVHVRQGREWKETRMFADLQICWSVFGNTYADGSIEFGHIVKGKRGFNAGVVVEDDQLLAGSSTVDATFWLDPAGFSAAAGPGHRFETRYFRGVLEPGSSSRTPSARAAAASLGGRFASDVAMAAFDARAVASASAARRLSP